VTAHLTQENLDIYGHADVAWSVPLRQLDAGEAQRFWLATTGPGGRPHLTGLGARWLDGRLYFVSGAGTAKSRNLVRCPACAVSAELPDLDLTLKGRAEQVTDQPTIERLAAHWAATGWPARAGLGVIEADYSAPSAGPSPWELWVLSLQSAVGVGAMGAMRWRFA
jgi:Pyridoxamine 5'-phosphate oxidase